MTIMIVILALISLIVSPSLGATLKPVKGTVQVGKLKMSPIGGGTWAWGNQFLWGYNKKEDQELKNTYDFVTNNGMNWFDTADSYGTGALAGRSESLLGDFYIDGDGNKSKKPVYFCTKLAPFPWRIGKDSMKKVFTGSKERMKKDKVDMLQLHWPPTLGWQESNYLEAFSELVKADEAVQIGLSNFGPDGLQRVNDELEKKGTKVYSNQVQFSLLSRQPLTSGLADLCGDLNIQPIGYSPLALGLLTDKYKINSLPKGPRGILFREFLPIMDPLLNTLRDIAKKRGKTVSQVALNWNLQKGFLVLVGIRTVAQAKENLGATGWSLSGPEMDEIDKVAGKLPKSLIQNPNQSN